MNVAGIAWVVLTPYATGVLVGSVPRVNRVVADHISLTTAVGWTAAAALLAGVFLLPGSSGIFVTLASAPLVGLTFWLPSRGGGGDDAPEKPDDQPSSGDRVDWNAFERELRDWQRERDRDRKRERIPA